MSLELDLVILKIAGGTIWISLQSLIYKNHYYANLLILLQFPRLALKELLPPLLGAYRWKTNDFHDSFLIGQLSFKDYIILSDLYLVLILIKMQIQSVEKISKFGYYSMQLRLSALGIGKKFLLTRKSHKQNLYFFFVVSDESKSLPIRP